MIAHFIWKYGTFGCYQEVPEYIKGIGRVTTFFPGVVMFFSMSGYLICSSLDRNVNLKEYFVKRAFRLFPELWVCTLINFIMLLVIVPEILDKSIGIWLLTQIFGIANTPSCLQNFATGSVNGALWTIFTEFQFYIVIAFIYKYLKRLSISKWTIVLAVFAGINIICDFIADTNTGLISKLIERCFATYFIWFLIGCFLYEKRNVMVPLLKKCFLPLVAVYSLYKWGGVHTPGYYAEIGIGVLCSLITISIAYTFKRVTIKHDITYGIFLYHWIVMNFMIHFKILEKVEFGVALGIFISISVLLAWMSYKFVGDIANKLMKKFL